MQRASDFRLKTCNLLPSQRLLLQSEWGFHSSLQNTVWFLSWKAIL